MNMLDTWEVQPLHNDARNLNQLPLLLQIQGLHKAFDGQIVLNEVTVDLRQSEVVLLRGANGSGKTTLLNILTGNLQPNRGVIKLLTNSKPSEFKFPKPWWQAGNPFFDNFTPERLAQQGISRTWQGTRLFSTQSLQDNIAVATPQQLGEQPAWAVLRRLAVLKQERKNLRTATRGLAKLGLQNRVTSSADKVSLGQSKRVAIARALQAKAQILFLDEPLSGLDAAGITEVIHLLRQVAQEEKVTLVIVEHVFNIPRILDLATTVWTLAGGELKVETPAQVKKELAQMPRDGIQSWLRKLAGVKGNIQEQTLPGGAILSTVTVAGINPGAVVLEVENLTVYRGKRLVLGASNHKKLEGISFRLRFGELAVLQAPNGWGKTTLLEAITGIIPASGSIQLKGQSIAHFPVWQRIRCGLAMLQSRDNTFPNLTVREMLQIANVKEIPANLRNLLHKGVSSLSGGEKQRVVIACSQAKPATVLLMDEPFLALDIAGLKTSWELIQPQAEKAYLISVPSAIIEE